jgi:serine/threonine-protein kinase
MDYDLLKPGDLLMRKYRIERQLGAGAMGVVYAATNVDLGQRVAIKVLKPHAAEGNVKARFLREARASVRLKTEHVARVLDVGTTDDGAPYMLMEHLDGRDLGEELRARGPLPFEEAVEYVLQVCEALAEAHAAGIVHRDIKPSNLFLTTGTGGLPRVKVLDFGISKVVDDVGLTGNLVLGSPLYMSPEHMQRSADVDARADIWSLGVTLYQLVAGTTPFHADQIAVVCALVFQKPPAPLSNYRADAPPGFEAVLGTCLEKERTRRFPNVAALAAALVPYAPPRAALYAERAALALGENVVVSRPTAELPAASALVTAASTSAGAPLTASAERSGAVAVSGEVASNSAALRAPMASSPAATGSPTVSAAMTNTTPARSRVGLFAGLIGAAAVGGLVAAAVIGMRERGGVGTAGASTAGPSAKPANESSEPRKEPSPLAPSTTAEPAPTAQASATASAAGATAPSTAPAATSNGAGAKVGPRSPSPSPRPQQAPQPTQKKRNIYDQ